MMPYRNELKAAHNKIAYLEDKIEKLKHKLTKEYGDQKTIKTSQNKLEIKNNELKELLKNKKEKIREMKEQLKRDEPCPCICSKLETLRDENHSLKKLIPTIVMISMVAISIASTLILFTNC
jgi:chromosome segregation ATPase